jgi:ComF family protein
MNVPAGQADQGRREAAEGAKRRFGWLRAGAAACWSGAWALLFPPRCACCQEDLPGPLGEVLLCEACREQLAPPDWEGCPRCGGTAPRQAAGGGAPFPSRSAGCPLCTARRFAFDGVVVLGEYDALLREVILRMKRPTAEPLARVMGELFVERRGAALEALEVACVVAIPSFWLRKMRQGGGSPSVVAQQIARRLKIPLRSGWLLRRRNTLPQADLTPLERVRNVRGAFGVRRSARLGGRRVLLVDDILTTGATCDEVARMLKQAGAAAVFAAVLGRAHGAQRA